jgi:hypothetical protein
MANSVPELIAIELISRLESITTANGYDMTARVYRVNRDAANGWSPKNYDIVVVEGDEARNTEIDCPGNPPAVGYDFPISIQAYIRQSDRSTVPEQRLAKNFVANIRKAVATPSAWHTFGGNAINSDIGTASFFRSDDGSHSGMTMELMVMYRVSETNPFQVR